MLLLPARGFLERVQVEEAVGAGPALPVEVLAWIAVAFECETRGFACGTVSERHVVIGDVVEEVDLGFVEHQPGRDGVHRGVAPAFVEEAAVHVEGAEVVDVLLRAEPVEIADFEVGPL